MASSPVDATYSGNKKKKLKAVADASGSGGGRVSTPSLSRKALSASPNAGTVGTAAGVASQDKDSHPFSKGSVIEVLCPSYSKKDGWWSETESSDEEGAGSDAMSSARLCDVIDRAFVNNSWRYYVHYRDFNRRMDEWIGVDRIVSPPSVGNAKARALKKKQKTGHGSTAGGASTTPSLLSNAVAEPDSSAPRGRRRTSLLQESATLSSLPQEAIEAAKDAAAPTMTKNADGSTSGGTVQYMTSAVSIGESGVGVSTGVGVIGGARRRRQSSRRKADDDATVVTSNIDDDEQQAETGVIPQNQQQGKLRSKIKSQQIVLPDAVTTHTVGEHVVATVHAQELDEHEGLDEASLREHEEVTKVKNVNFLELGEFQMETWYFSPLPKELCGPSGFLEVLYVCEFTFNMFSRKAELRRFQSRLEPHMRHPPGNEIYRCRNLSMFEVDGLEEKIYCQNLCYIAKLFLDHKTLYFDVDPFLFYVLCEVDNRGFHPVGYFSKEKYSDVGYNLACILTFPAHQRKGYGRFLISFSYELTKKEEKVGSPEKPMSDLGQQAYKPYWASTIVDFLLHESTEPRLSIMDIAKKTSIMAEDIVFTLNQLGILKIINGVYFIAAEKTLLSRLAQRYPVKEPRVDPSKLHWTPFLTDVKRDKFSIHSKKPSVEMEEKKVG